MGSTVSQKIWPQYMNTKDCTLGFCSLYCPQRCYFILPPPPPFKHFPHESSSSTRFSPFMITIIIAILATAFLFAVYYTIISKFCGKIFSTTRTDNTQDPDMELGGVNEPPLHEPWFVSKNGLDEVLIRSIAAFKYKRGEGLIEGTDCSVCLSEFVEDESLKLLPKCSHAFHLQCIDAWLKCHSNCPLCRANVAVTTTSSALSLPLDSPRLNEPPSQSQDEAAEITANLEIVIRDQEFEGINVAKTPSRSVEIAIDQEGNDEHMRRSLSMGEMNRHI